MSFILELELLILTLVADIAKSEIHLNWTTPVLSSADNVASYCVRVANASSLLILHFECGITATMFSFPFPSDIACTIYYYTVIAVNDKASNIVNATHSYPNDRKGMLKLHVCCNNN